MTVQRTRYVDADTLEPTPENALRVLRGEITPIRSCDYIEPCGNPICSMQYAPRPHFHERLAAPSPTTKEPVDA